MSTSEMSPAGAVHAESWIRRWPFLKQLRGDPLGLTGAAPSDASARQQSAAATRCSSVRKRFERRDLAASFQVRNQIANGLAEGKEER